MPSKVAIRVVAIVMILAVVLSTAATALGQEADGDAPQSQVPTPDIIPEPNSGEAPTEAGDRGGALQLLLLAGIAAAVGGIAWHVTRQARAARERRDRGDRGGRSGQSTRARQASMPSTNPER